MSVALRTSSNNSGNESESDPQHEDRADRTVSGPSHGRRRSESRHRRTRWASAPTGLLPILRLGLPSVVLVGLAAVLIIASLVSPNHTGPLPLEVVLVIVACSPALVYAASRRVGPSILGALVAAALTACLLTTASSDVAGVPEHASVALGLASVAVWPRHDGTALRRYISGALAGLSIAVSPLAAVAVIAAAARLILRSDDRVARIKSLMGPVITGAAALLLGFALLVLTGWIAVTTWAGTVSLATLVVAIAPAIGVAAGLGVDGALAGIGGRDRLPLIAGVVGLMMITLLMAATVGATVAQLHDRTVAVTVGPQTGVVPTRSEGAVVPNPVVTPSASPDADADRRLAAAQQLLRNPNLTLGTDARELLEDAAVDRRVMLVVGQLLTDRTLTIADFPETVDGEPVRRALLVTEADGDTLGTGGSSVPILTAYLSGLSGSYEVETVSVDSRGVLATFPPAD